MASDSETDSRAKKPRLEAEPRSIEACFASNLFASAEAVREQYRHAVIRPLIDDALLRNVRKEILDEIHFTQKETDIYRVRQTGDLANLSGLPQHEQEKLKSVVQLRKALYSTEFRELLSHITGCGPLSGTKTDMSINLYDKGCHLLNHDDVIGSRSISYILYLTDPDEPWRPEYGGALRLYPTRKPGFPEPNFTVQIPPQWNQLSFFQVQPGHSFHDVEEVRVDKPRLAISGWFHVPQKDEPGYSPAMEKHAGNMSTLQSLMSSESDELEEPKPQWYPCGDEGELTAADREALAKFVNPLYLEAGKMAELREEFVDTSMLCLHDFLRDDISAEVRRALVSADTRRNLDTVEPPWKISMPPHKHRYLYITQENSAQSLLPMQQMLSSAYERWLRLVTGEPIHERFLLARQFRPGSDYTLAAGDTGADAVLETTLDLSVSEDLASGENGGYQIYMAADDADDDEDAAATYRNTDAGDDGEDGILVTSQPEFNVLTIVLRESGILKFVKYVNSAAGGSRYDISGQYKAQTPC